jgi:protein gp37
MTRIEWTDESWNPIVGCSVVSPGCTNCYAMRQAGRLLDKPGSHYEGTTQGSKAGPVWTGKVSLAPEHILSAPLRWKKPRRVFVNSMGDLFHEDAPDEWIDKVFAVMALAPQHTFQVLTKRPERMRDWATRDLPHSPLTQSIAELYTAHPEVAATHPFDKERAIEVATQGWPLPNVWLGVSCEDQARAEERIPPLLDTPAAVRFVSAEPLLGPVYLSPKNRYSAGIQPSRYCCDTYDPLRGHGETDTDDVGSGVAYTFGPKIDWVIVGGESGPGARPMHPDWARSLRDQCASAGVPFFFKQWGGHAPHTAYTSCGTIKPEDRIETMARVGKAKAGRLLDGREHNEMPERQRESA